MTVNSSANSVILILFGKFKIVCGVLAPRAPPFRMYDLNRDSYCISKLCELVLRLPLYHYWQKTGVNNFPQFYAYGLIEWVCVMMLSLGGGTTNQPPGCVHHCPHRFGQFLLLFIITTIHYQAAICKTLRPLHHYICKSWSTNPADNFERFETLPSDSLTDKGKILEMLAHLKIIQIWYEWIFL